MVNALDAIDNILGIVPVLRAILIVVIVFLIFSFMLRALKRALLKKARTKKQISNIEIFSKILSYVILLIISIFAIFSYSGSWTGLGITVGLMSAALGWALQKPITGMAAWVMVVIKRPFDIGDRVTIGNIKGDIINITLTHVYIHEVGGIVEGEESSGRIIMVPNSTLFEQNIVNYTLRNEYVLDQVSVIVTHESNIDKAIKISSDSAKSLMKEFIQITKKEPYVRTFFQPNGVSIHVRYFSPAQRLQEFSSKITKEILGRIMKSKDVNIAYQRAEIISRGKKTKFHLRMLL